MPQSLLIYLLFTNERERAYFLDLSLLIFQISRKTLYIYIILKISRLISSLLGPFIFRRHLTTEIMNPYEYGSDSDDDPDNYPISLWMFRNKEEDVTFVKIPSAMVRDPTHLTIRVVYGGQ